MQEQDRLASVEAEKRLKAALTAKREPNSGGSRMTSPSTMAVEGTVESKSTPLENGLADEGGVETDPPAPSVPPQHQEVTAFFGAMDAFS